MMKLQHRRHEIRKTAAIHASLKARNSAFGHFAEAIANSRSPPPSRATILARCKARRSGTRNSERIAFPTIEQEPQGQSITTNERCGPVGKIATLANSQSLRSLGEPSAYRRHRQDDVIDFGQKNPVISTARRRISLKRLSRQLALAKREAKGCRSCSGRSRHAPILQTLASNADLLRENGIALDVERVWTAASNDKNRLC